MRIAVISSTVFSVPTPGYSGLEHLAWLQAKGLAAKGHEVSLIAPEGSTCPGVTIIPSCPPGQWDESKAYGGYWQRLLDFDAVLDHSWAKWAYILKQEGRLKCPVLGVCHAPVNTMYHSLPEGIDKPCFVCISQDQANHFQALFSREARVAYNGVDLNYYKPLNILRSRRYLFLARFSSIKGPDIAIDACLRAGESLDLIGDTSITNEPQYFEHCKQKASEGQNFDRRDSYCGTANYIVEQIRMVGPASRGACVWWFSQAHCLLHPNQRFREPFGLAPVEAQACGVPVIAWNYGAMRETVRHGETGFLVSSLDDMVELIRSRAVEGLDRNKCREWASQFSEQRMIDRYDELIREAVETGGW